MKILYFHQYFNTPRAAGGIRPNFMKIAPFIHAIHTHNAAAAARAGWQAVLYV